MGVSWGKAVGELATLLVNRLAVNHQTAKVRNSGQLQVYSINFNAPHKRRAQRLNLAAKGAAHQLQVQQLWEPPCAPSQHAAQRGCARCSLCAPALPLMPPDLSLLWQRAKRHTLFGVLAYQLPALVGQSATADIGLPEPLLFYLCLFQLIYYGLHCNSMNERIKSINH